MNINIGNKNRIKKSNIGYKNNCNIEQGTKDNNRFVKVVVDIAVGIIVGLIVAFLMYNFGWN